MTIRVNEQSTFEYRCQLRNERGDLIVNVDLSALTIPLYDVDTDTIINSRDGQDMLNANGGELFNTLQTDSDGNEYNFRWNSNPLDSVIVNAAKETELHAALFEWTYGNDSGATTVYIRVVNLHRRP